MRSRDAVQRLKLFDVDEKERKVQALEQMIRDFEQMAGDLDRQIQAEEDRTGITEPDHFNYSTFAKSAAVRRANLLDSIYELQDKLEISQRELEEARAEVEPLLRAEGRELGTAGLAGEHRVSSPLMDR